MIKIIIYDEDYHLRLRLSFTYKIIIYNKIMIYESFLLGIH